MIESIESSTLEQLESCRGELEVLRDWEREGGGWDNVYHPRWAEIRQLVHKIKLLEQKVDALIVSPPRWLELPESW